MKIKNLNNMNKHKRKRATDNKKRLLCNSIIKGISCSYGSMCSYSHDICQTFLRKEISCDGRTRSDVDKYELCTECNGYIFRPYCYNKNICRDKFCIYNHNICPNMVKSGYCLDKGCIKGIHNECSDDKCKIKSSRHAYHSNQDKKYCCAGLACKNSHCRRIHKAPSERLSSEIINLIDPKIKIHIDNLVNLYFILFNKAKTQHNNSFFQNTLSNSYYSDLDPIRIFKEYIDFFKKNIHDLCKDENTRIYFEEYHSSSMDQLNFYF